MKDYRRPFLFLPLILGLILLNTVAQEVKPASPLQFRIRLAGELAVKATGGRLFVFMTDTPQPRENLSTGFVPGSTWIAAQEITHLAPDMTVLFDPDKLAAPNRFSQAKPGNYQIMALLDTDHTFAYNGQNENDLLSAVIKVENLNPADTSPIEVTLSRRPPSRPKPKDTESVKLVEFQSPALTRFWGRPILMRAGVVLPPSYATDGKRSFATVYHVHGFGGDHSGAWRQSASLLREMKEGKYGEMVHVYLDASFSTGHHVFADSVNNGPWGRALTEELIPHLEKNFRLAARPAGRFLTGHSSGGWSTLWLQVAYPDFFGGTWSTAPDPVDLRSFTGIDATAATRDNAYRTSEGAPHQLVRRGGKFIVSIQEFVRHEEVTGEYGGQFASFEWVWSPRGRDGRPMKLFNRETGEINPEVTKAWEKYDIRLILARNWKTLGPKLRGKINVICGSEDTFRLEEATRMLCDFFRQQGSDAVCELVPGRDHSNLYQPYQSYPDGLAIRIYREMSAKFEKASPSKR